MLDLIKSTPTLNSLFVKKQQNMALVFVVNIFFIESQYFQVIIIYDI